MPKPRFQRRKEDRPAEITEAALAAFSEKGFAATKVEDVAKRAGVSKGLLYLYFRTKEDLLKAVIRSFVQPRVAELTDIVAKWDGTSEEFLRGPFLGFIQGLPASPARVIVRLMVSEGHKHPDVVAYYWDNVISEGLAALRQLVARGVSRGEFNENALDEFPHLIAAPVIFSLVYKLVFERQQSLDTDRMLEVHVDILLNYLISGGEPRR